MIYNSVKYIAVLSIILLTYSCNGQTGTEDNQLPQSYLNILKQQCPNPDIIEVERKADGNFEIDFICDGIAYEILLQENTLLYTSFKVPLEEIPFDIIDKKLQKSYPGYLLDEISKIVTADTSFLKVEVIKDGIEQNLYFTLDGKWFKMKPVGVSDKWNLQSVAQTQKYTEANYHFYAPDRGYELPELLREISGVAVMDSTTVFCIQDELGSVFQYDLRQGEIVNSYRFTDKGDFEDIALHDSTLMILRSDGHVFFYDLRTWRISSIQMPVKSLNVEGLCIDNGYVYLANKDALINSMGDTRIIYRSPLDNPAQLESYLEVNISSISDFIAEHYPEIGSAKVRFNPSAVAIHPKTHEMFVLSAEDRIIAIYKNKHLKNVIPLPSDLYYKPEGLSFYNNGDLMISSEGDKNGFVKGSIHIIPYNNPVP